MIIISKLSLTQEFVKAVELKILKGEWEIGQRVPTLRELAESMNLSRSVINAGIVELINKGYLKTVPRKWTVVNNWRREGTLAVVNGIMEYRIYDETLLKSIFDSRMLIECECAYKAAANRTNEDLYKLKKIIQSEQRPDRTIDEVVLTDLMFHHTIAVASGNMVYPLMLKSFEHSTYKLIHDFYSEKDVYQFVYNHHLRLYKAIKEKDADAAKNIMQELLVHGEKVVNKVLKEV